MLSPCHYEGRVILNKEIEDKCTGGKIPKDATYNSLRSTTLSDEPAAMVMLVWGCPRSPHTLSPRGRAHNEPLCDTNHHVPLLHIVGLKQDYSSDHFQECSLDGMEFFLLLLFPHFMSQNAETNSTKRAQKLLEKFIEEGSVNSCKTIVWVQPAVQKPLKSWFSEAGVVYQQMINLNLPDSYALS